MAWFRRFVTGTRPGESYQCSCACGHPFQGLRRRQPQIFKCPLCGNRVFVLALSPWTVSPHIDPNNLQAKATQRKHRLAWIIPVIVGVGLLAGLGVGFTLLLPYLGRNPPAPVEDNSGDEARAAIERGKQALAEGRYEKAFKELNAISVRTGLLTPLENRQLTRLQEQSLLLSRLLSRPLQDIVHDASLVRDEEEWKDRFSREYRGKSVVFDDQVRLSAGGKPVLGYYVVRHGDDVVRVALEDLDLMRKLPLNTPQRLLFGAQLQSVEREQGGNWVIRFMPGSGVLLTDACAASACFPGPLDDEVLGLLQRQADLLR